ncbi:MAG: DUF4405 domain-containing protein [Bacteroidales bacterium]|nr:DUF4405 domain-containing protein [Bacteroidales bacterium]
MNNKFSWQSFISIGLLLSFVIMLISGIILYIAPEGSISRWIGWKVFNLTKGQWEQQHTIFSFLFMGFSIFHIFSINWRLLLSYFTLRKKKLKNIRELIISLIITIIVFTGTYFNFSPLKTIINIGKNVSESYSVNAKIPEIPDAEKLSIKEFSGKVFNISLPELELILNKNNLNLNNTDIPVNEFCGINKITPQEFYLLLKNEISVSGNTLQMESFDFSSD